ncbi:MAG: hypothetical protein QJT81_11345 [Candidatus Thiothrix putei]|uniref:Uncharacterized protein n=1 Tax=Candidatus Thiothrix putei TaxID=3080811 RepID=A0AA95KK01_9GAMM|nr:MAG: hypothetical protein QJT81_11345 [Candidatus Thiothrix putei]
MQIDLWSDCDAVPFRFRVHIKQHNERILGLSLGMPKGVRDPIKSVQQSLRFSGDCHPDKPETYLASLSHRFDSITNGDYGNRLFWEGAMQALEGKLLRFDTDDGAVLAQEMDKVYPVSI